MIGVQTFASIGKQALLAAAGPPVCLLLTGRLAKIRGRSAHIMDIPLKVRHSDNFTGFPQYGFLAAALNYPSLMRV